MAKITYDDKEAIQNDASLANKNKVTDADMNEIKQVVNANYDELTELAESLSEFEEAENLSGNVRIFNLEAGFYKVAKDSNIYYKGATDNTALSGMGDLLLFVAVSKDSSYKHWVMFNGTGEELGYIRVGHTMSSGGTYVEYKSTAVKELITKVQTLETDNTTNKSNITALQALVTALQSTVANKVDKVDGKGLSTEDFTTALKQKLEGLNNYDDTEIKEDIATNTTNISTLQTAVEEIQEEQEIQNTQIQALQQENALLKEQIPTRTS